MANIKATLNDMLVVTESLSSFECFDRNLDSFASVGSRAVVH
jgi:hypothetical protein